METVAVRFESKIVGWCAEAQVWVEYRGAGTPCFVKWMHDDFEPRRHSNRTETPLTDCSG